MDLSHAMDPFASSFYSYGNRRGFKAQLLAVPMEESSTYFLLPRRILKLYPNSGILPGDRLRDETTGKQYLAGENGPSVFSNKVIHTTMKLFEVTHLAAPYVTKEKLTDEITGLEKQIDEGQSTIVAVIEFTKMQEDEMRIGADLARIITNVPVKIGDRIDHYTVVNVESQLGLYFSTARAS